MKKIYAVLTAILVMLWPATAYAAVMETAAPTPEITTAGTTAGAGLTINNSNIFEGMDKAYKDGYTPTVQNQTATIVLPLVSSGAIEGNAITAAAGLGDTTDSPFVFKNYEKTVNLNSNPISTGTSVSSYLVRFDLSLASGRFNGVYPVTIEIQAQGSDGSLIQQTFTTYVTITDGKDPNAVPIVVTPSSQPKVIVSSYSVNPSPVVAGGEFTATVTLKNTSAIKSVQNMTVTVSCDSPDFYLKNNSNTFYINWLANGTTTDIELTYKTDLKTPAQQFNITLAINYDSSEGTPLTSTGSVAVQVTQPLEEGTAAAGSLSIDNSNIYEDMDKAYKDGYMPAVNGGTATVILPLVSNGEIKGYTITATPGLGDMTSSPFVIKNYVKTVNLNSNPVSTGVSISSYLVRFDLSLAAGRINGVYPVTIEIQAQGADGSPILQTFISYVTITDGKDPETAQPTPEAEEPSSQPKVIVSSYSVNPSPVVAGGEFTATVTLKNTSEIKSVQNMTVTVSCESPNLSMKNESSTFYINRLASGKTEDIALAYKTDLETPAQQFNITLDISYDNTEGTPLTSAGVVSVQVSQPLSVEMATPQIAAHVTAGDTMPVTFEVMNMGRSKIYNVRCELSAPGLIPASSAFIGNMEAGTAGTGNMDVFIGTKDMTDGYTGTDKYGSTSGKITLIYEDEAGNQYTQDTEITTIISEAVINTSDDTTAEDSEKAGQWWISIVIGGIVVAALTVFLIARRNKDKHNEEI